MNRILVILLVFWRSVSNLVQKVIYIQVNLTWFHLFWIPERNMIMGTSILNFTFIIRKHVHTPQLTILSRKLWLAASYRMFIVPLNSWYHLHSVIWMTLMARNPQMPIRWISLNYIRISFLPLEIGLSIQENCSFPLYLMIISTNFEDEIN